MRLAVSSGPLPYDPAAVDERVAAKVAELGFTGVAVHFGYGLCEEPEDLDPRECRRAAEIFSAYGIRVVQSWAWEPNLVHPDAEVRRVGVRRLAGAARVAAALGAESVSTGSGSNNLRGGFWPHRENHTEAARERLVESLRAAVGAAEEHGVVIALEGHVATTLDTPEAVRETIDAVGSPAVRANLDPVNFVGDLRALWASTDVVRRALDVVGPVTVSGHVKDVYAEERLVVHLSETILGDGEFDLRSYLAGFEELLPDAYLVVEHLPEDVVGQAKARLDALLRELGIRAR